MDYRESPPPIALEGIATRLWLLDAVPQRRLEKILPLPFVHLIVNLSEPYRIFALDGSATLVADAFVSGLQRQCLVIESPERIRHVGIELTPAGLHALAPLRASASAGEVLDARAVVPGTDDLVVRLRAAAPDEAMRVLGEHLATARVGDPDPLVVATVRAIDADLDRTIVSIARELGISLRALIARFRRVTGTTPKQYAQVRRFHRFIDGVQAAGGPPDWAQLAAAGGYYDQSHVIRAFRRFSGWTPAEYHRLVAQHGPDAAHFVPLERLPATAGQAAS